MEKIKGSEIIELGLAETDYAGYPIEPDTEYVVDHVNCAGGNEYVSVTGWNNSHDAANQA